MINFDAVDFSERRSEEIMFLLTLSVCTNNGCTVEPYYNKDLGTMKITLLYGV